MGIFKYQWVVMLGTLVGGLLASWIGPRMIAWYFSPPIDVAISCRPAIEWAMYRFQWVQAAGLLTGFIFSTLLYFSLRKKKIAEPELL